MGKDVEHRVFTREDRTRFRHKVRRCLDAVARMLQESMFDVDQPYMGLEIEFNLIDDRADPAFRNAQVLDAIGDPAFQTELAQFNVEINVEPRRLWGVAFKEFEDDLRDHLNGADAKARSAGARLVMVGILPTLTTDHMTLDALSANPRYELLNEQIFTQRGEDVRIAIDGVERLSMTSDSITPEACCTSTQLHVQVSPETFPAYWNAAQSIAGVQAAICANSPFLFGRELWRETRITLFQQAIDTRTDELKAQGVRPRVWFGERWISSIFDLFEENSRYFPALLPVTEDEDPIEMLDRGRAPGLHELRLHNGTIYRWNRPVYDVVHGKPHLRVENRVLPAGPTVVDTLANAAFYFGLVKKLAEDERPLWTRMSFGAAEENFVAGARDGIDATLYWPGIGTISATELVLRKLLPLAHEGLDRWGVDATQRDWLLGLIEQRCLSGQNGASWQARTFHRLFDGGRMDRLDALREMTRRYADFMAENVPVHTWPVD